LPHPMIIMAAMTAESRFSILNTFSTNCPRGNAPQ